MIDEKVLIEKLEEEKQINPCENMECQDCKYRTICYSGEQRYKVGMDNVVAIVNQLAEETIHESSSKNENVLESSSRSRKVIYK